MIYQNDVMKLDQIRVAIHRKSRILERWNECRFRSGLKNGYDLKSAIIQSYKDLVECIDLRGPLKMGAGKLTNSAPDV
jgi:hypothetical protein